MEVYKPVIKKFLGKDVRIVTVGYDEYIVLKDMFDVLGRLRPTDGQIHGDDRNKLNQFLSDLNKEVDVRTLVVDFGKKRGRGNASNGSIQTVDYLKIETIPIVLTQFRPTARKGQEALNEWIKFMKFVEGLLREGQAHKVILKDKEVQKEESSIIVTVTGKKMVVVNSDICRLMAELVGVYPEVRKLTKDDLKIYQPQLTIDLIEVRQEALNIYRQQLIITESHKQAYDGTLKYLKKMYKL